MNNSRIALESVSLSLESGDISEKLQEREALLVKIIDAIEGINQSSEWSTLKSLVFEGLTESLEKQLKFESEKSQLNDPEIYRLQGKLWWAKKYSDLEKLRQEYRAELSNVRKQLNKNE